MKAASIAVNGLSSIAIAPAGAAEARIATADTSNANDSALAVAANAFGRPVAGWTAVDGRLVANADKALSAREGVHSEGKGVWCE